MVPQASQQQIVQERDRLRLLLDVNNAVVSTLSLKHLLLAVSGWLRQYLAYDLASMVVLDEESGQLSVHALDGSPPGGILDEGALLPLEGTPPGLALATRKTVRRDRTPSPILSKPQNSFATNPTRSNLTVYQTRRTSQLARCNQTSGITWASLTT